jgi:hypothetical protein
MAIAQNALNLLLAVLTIFGAVFESCKNYENMLFECYSKRLGELFDFLPHFKRLMNLLFTLCLSVHRNLVDLFALGLFIAAVALTTFIATFKLVKGVKEVSQRD